jgi:hypothetical protein
MLLLPAAVGCPDWQIADMQAYRLCAELRMEIPCCYSRHTPVWAMHVRHLVILGYRASLVHGLHRLPLSLEAVTQPNMAAAH